MSSNFKQQLKQFYKESEELDQALKDESVMYLQYRDGATERDIEVERDGKKITIKEAELWEAQRFGSREAIEWIKNQYPMLWELAEKREKQKQECDKLLVEIFGFTLDEMTPYKLVKMVDVFTQSKK